MEGWVGKWVGGWVGGGADSRAEGGLAAHGRDLSNDWQKDTP